jgi:hypothetical protein
MHCGDLVGETHYESIKLLSGSKYIDSVTGHGFRGCV